MSSDALYNAVHDHLAASWTSTPLAWENEPFTAPAPAAPWVKVQVAGKAYQLVSLGNGAPADQLWRETGTVWFRVYVPLDGGTALARQYARQLVELFKGLELDTGRISFADASIGLGELGSVEAGYWKLSASVDWQRDA